MTSNSLELMVVWINQSLRGQAWRRKHKCRTAQDSLRADLAWRPARAFGVWLWLVRVVIPAGASLRTAAESLSRAGDIGSASLFRFYASLRRGDRGIKAGTYLLHRRPRVTTSAPLVAVDP